ncbi:protein of unknown function [Methylocaldum szegediense]|uniref:Uncharacterized protein n=1 Tax=Methylocaldum szegediense TaxID=73780 RepID=A0ABN8X7R6_9GAMM|nr:protein of unknown function [Methylocaldum szegediense]
MGRPSKLSDRRFEKECVLARSTAPRERSSIWLKSQASISVCQAPPIKQRLVTPQKLFELWLFHTEAMWSSDLDRLIKCVQPKRRLGNRQGCTTGLKRSRSSFRSRAYRFF